MAERFHTHIKTADLLKSISIAYLEQLLAEPDPEYCQEFACEYINNVLLVKMKTVNSEEKQSL